jgi:hypothetical protein
MSTTGQALPRTRRVSTGLVIAIVLALAIGAAIGSVVTQLVVDTAPVARPAAASTWDPQKLTAMEGRQLAASVPIRWDAEKLAAMDGRQLAALQD